MLAFLDGPVGSAAKAEIGIVVEHVPEVAGVVDPVAFDDGGRALHQGDQGGVDTSDASELPPNPMSSMRQCFAIRPVYPTSASRAKRQGGGEIGEIRGRLRRRGAAHEMRPARFRLTCRRDRRQLSPPRRTSAGTRSRSARWRRRGTPAVGETGHARGEHVADGAEIGAADQHGRDPEGLRSRSRHGVRQSSSGTIAPPTPFDQDDGAPRRPRRSACLQPVRDQGVEIGIVAAVRARAAMSGESGAAKRNGAMRVEDRGIGVGARPAAAREPGGIGGRRVGPGSKPLMHRFGQRDDRASARDRQAPTRPAETWVLPTSGAGTGDEQGGASTPDRHRVARMHRACAPGRRAGRDRRPRTGAAEKGRGEGGRCPREPWGGRMATARKPSAFQRRSEASSACARGADASRATMWLSGTGRPAAAAMKRRCDARAAAPTQRGIGGSISARAPRSAAAACAGGREPGRVDERCGRATAAGPPPRARRRDSRR